MIYVGVDNGLTGGIVAINNRLDVVGKWVMPIIETNKKEFDVITIQKIFDDLLKKDKKIFVALEKAHPRPVQGTRAAFTTGFCYGMFQGILGSKGISYDIVNPSLWMKLVFEGMNIKDKKASTIWAQRKFPKENWRATERTKIIHDGLTDAAALAYYCFLVNGGKR